MENSIIENITGSVKTSYVESTRTEKNMFYTGKNNIVYLTEFDRN